MTEYQKKTVGVAVTSLIFGILGFLLLGIIGGIVAVICGHVAKSKIAKDPQNLGGEGMALAGLIMGYVQIGISILIIPLLLAIALPTVSTARTRAMTVSTDAMIVGVETCIKLYEMDTDKLPDSLNDLLVDDGAEGWDGPYYSGKVIDFWGTPLIYASEGGMAKVFSAGPDMQPGTADDLTGEWARNRPR